MARVEMLLDCRCRLGESPVAYESGQLMFVDIDGCTIHSFDAVSNGHHRQVSTNGRMVGNVVPCASRSLPKADLLACLENSIVPVNFESSNCKADPIAEVPKAHLDTNRTFRFNDGKVDPNGRLWAGTMALDVMSNPHAETKSRLYCLQQSKTLKNATHLANYELVTKLEQVRLSNGLEWYGQHMFYADSLEPEVSVFDFNEDDGAISNRRRVVHIPDTRGVPDGMTVDANGKLWVVLCGGGAVIQIDPETNSEILCVELPVKCPTSVAFGGKDLSELYVTTSWSVEKSKGGEVSEHAGSLFRVTIPGVKGHSFARSFTQ